MLVYTNSLGITLMPTNTFKGTEFERRVASLLRSSTGYRNLQEQQHIRGVNVDMTFQKQWRPHKYLTIGVECKDWKSGLDRNALMEICFSYRPLLDNKDIDELWVITPNPVHATVQEFANGMSNIALFHINELEQDIIDFSIYAHYLIRQFDEEKLRQYYVQPRQYNSAKRIHDTILSWLAIDSAMPAAIWAGYGIGKTSYAKYLAAELAGKFLSDSSERIPIYVPLGDYYTSPRLDGLLSNVLTNNNGVHGYNYNTFLNLHEAGRFVIILDGFDEMKYAMTSAEFHAIALEIRRLIRPNSKVILLGRPSAIISGEEHELLVKGTRRSSGVDISDEIGIQFFEIRINFFTPGAYREFVTKYLRSNYSGPNKDDFIAARLRELEDANISEVMRRPVQARLLSQILLHPNNSIEKLSKYDLYNLFVDECLARESRKHARQRTSSNTLRRFMQDLAWWLWTTKRTRTFTIYEIPNSLSANYVNPNADVISSLRELLISSFTDEASIGLVEEKDAGTFYFPHQSFTEFLIADYVIDRRLSSVEFSDFVKSFNPEIESFLLAYTKEDICYSLYLRLPSYGVPITPQIISFLSKSSRLRDNPDALLADGSQFELQYAVEFFCAIEAEDSVRAVQKCLLRLSEIRSSFYSVFFVALLWASVKESAATEGIIIDLFHAIIGVLSRAGGIRSNDDDENPIEGRNIEFLRNIFGCITIDQDGSWFSFGISAAFAVASGLDWSAVAAFLGEKQVTCRLRTEAIRLVMSKSELLFFDEWFSLELEERRRAERREKSANEYVGHGQASISSRGGDASNDK